MQTQLENELHITAPCRLVIGILYGGLKRFRHLVLIQNDRDIGNRRRPGHGKRYKSGNI